MATMTAAETDALWAGIDDQRARTAGLLEGLSTDQWDHPSLCDGWTVRHVAAHLTLQQQSFGDVIGFIGRHPRMLRSVTLNATIHESAVIRAGALTTAEITDADPRHDRLAPPQRLRHAARDADRRPRPQPGHRRPPRAGPRDAPGALRPRREPPLGHPAAPGWHG